MDRTWSLLSLVWKDTEQRDDEVDAKERLAVFVGLITTHRKDGIAGKVPARRVLEIWEDAGRRLSQHVALRIICRPVCLRGDQRMVVERSLLCRQRDGF